jgi:hypothetical protein
MSDSHSFNLSTSGFSSGVVVAGFPVFIVFTASARLLNVLDPRPH